MAEKSKLRSRFGKGAIALALAGAMAVGGAGTAFAATTDYNRLTHYDTETSTSAYATVTTGEPDDALLTTYGVRAGSAGGDFMGLTNTNFDFTPGGAKLTTQYTDYTAFASSAPSRLDGLAIWASSVNVEPNPYYTNLLYKALTGTSSGYDEATTWMANPDTSSWGDSINGSAGMEFGGPSIVFGANKYTNFQNDTADGSNSGTNFYNNVSTTWAPEFVSNDATNIWTQVYTMAELAATADRWHTNESLTTRYNSSSAAASAADYEEAIRGTALYVAKQIDDTANPNVTADYNTTKKTVAYLYAIDDDETAYFFTPVASGLLNGDDTGKGVSGSANFTSATNPDDNYAANNGTIDLGYMAVLPFITNTYSSNTPFQTTTVYNDKTDAYVSGLSLDGIVMKVEDIYKLNPACKLVAPATSDNALANVNVIIYNSTVQSDLEGTSGGKNLSGVDNGYMAGMTPAEVYAWANEMHGFTGTVIAGDDWGTSTNQPNFGVNQSTAFTGFEAAPVLYCQRNYTADKNARAAWAIAKVYPELFANEYATYGYWVNKVYHVNTDDVASVVARMTGATGTIAYTDTIASDVERKAQDGLAWYEGTPYLQDWDDCDYYNGSSRASYYSGIALSEEEGDEIGIFSRN